MNTTYVYNELTPTHRLTLGRNYKSIVRDLSRKDLSQEDYYLLFFKLDTLEKSFESSEEFNKVLNFYERYRHKNWRLKKRISKIIVKESLFLTFTFTDKVLTSTNEDTRRRYVNRFLRSISTDYVGNLDYGKKNGREHYHAVVQCSSIDPTLWKYGALNVQRIRAKTIPLCLAKYLNKLTYHAEKQTANNHYIFSRKRFV